MSLSHSNISCLMHLMVLTHVTFFSIAKTCLYTTNMLRCTGIKCQILERSIYCCVQFFCVSWVYSWEELSHSVWASGKVWVTLDQQESKRNLSAPSLPATNFHLNPINNSGAEIRRVCGWIVTDPLPIKNFMQLIKTHVTRHL